jgi:hypothetical protein
MVPVRIGFGHSVGVAQERFAVTATYEAGDFIELHEGAEAGAAVECSGNHIRRPCGGRGA